MILQGNQSTISQDYNKMLDKVVILLLVLFFLLLFHYQLELYLLLYLLFLIVYVVVRLKKYVNLFHKRSLLFLLLFSSIFLSFIVNINRFNLTDITYYKIITNSVLLLFVFFFSFSIGYLLRESPRHLDRVMKIIVSLNLVNSVVTIIVWYVTTGGVISRYNFMSPITNSPSAGVNLSTLGFFLSLENIQLKKIITWIPPVVFLINVVIIITRMEQVVFGLILLCYIIRKISYKKTIRKVILNTFFLLILFSLVYFVNDFVIRVYSQYYVALFDRTNFGIVSRFEAIELAIRFYRENPFFGIGYGMYSVFLSKTINFGSTHNGFYSILAELGICGLLAYLILNVKIIVFIMRLYQSKSINNKYYFIFSVFLIVAILTFFVSNSMFLPPPSERIYYYYSSLLWLMFGLISKPAAREAVYK